MSTTIDERVVEMRFDNQNFERNARESMSTLDKLKRSLKLDGAAKGFEEIDSASRKVNMNGLGSAVETVSAKFSALQVIGVTALANITNQAVNAGKRMVAAFTIDPVKTGFQEYELKMGSVQTIMASTGESLATVNKYLEELNTYSDKTIYSFSDMTNNIGKFTNAGVKLEDAVLAIKGISNEAAVSGANANEASRAMYNFSQALSAGYVKLIDWKSIENANMATVEFKNQLIASAVACGTLKDNLDGTYTTLEKGTVISATRNFNDSLQEQWMTTEVLTKTLANYATDVREMSAAEKEAYEEKLRGQGYTEEQIKSIEKLGQKAFDSAQDIKTFSMMMDTLKEAAQSGWARTWELLIGDFEQAKAFWTELGGALGGFIDKMSKARNDLLESALGKGFTSLIDNVKKAVNPIQKSADSIKAVVDSVKDYAQIVDEIIGGKWGTGQARWDKLAEAGYDWAHAQNLVNEKLGNTKRHATDYKEALDNVAESQGEVANTSEKLTDKEKNQLKMMMKLTDYSLGILGYSEDQIAALNELRVTADKLGLSVEDFIDNIDEIDGRWLLINSLKNAGKGLVTVFQSIGKAWKQAFHGDATDEEILNKKSEAIFNFIAAMHRGSVKLLDGIKNNAENLTRTFKGLFAIVDVITTIAGGGLKFAFKILSKVLGAFDLNVLELTANVGDALVKFRDWLFENNALAKSINGLIEKIPAGIQVVKGWIEAFMELPAVQKVMQKVGGAFDYVVEHGAAFIDGFVTNLITKIPEAISAIKRWIDAFMELPQVQKAIEKFSKGFSDAIEDGKNFIEGFINGLKEGSLSIPGAIIEIGKMIIQIFKDILGIHSPSVITHEDGVNFVQGFINGVKSMIKEAVEIVKNFASSVINYVQSIDWSKILAVGISVSMVWFVKRVGDALKGIASAFKGFGDILENVAKIEKSISKVLNGISWDFKAKAIQKMAFALAILVASVVILAKVGGDDFTALWHSVVIIGALAAILAGLAYAMNQLDQASVSFEKGKGLNINGLKSGLIAIGAAILLIAAAVKLMGSMNQTEIEQGFNGLIGIVIAVSGVFLAYGKLVKGKSAQNMDKLGGMLIKLSISILLLAWVCKLVGKLSPEEMLAGAVFAEAFVLFFLQLTAITKLSGKGIDKLGGMMIKIAFSMILMVSVCKLASKLSAEEMLKGAAFALVFTKFLKYLVRATNIGKSDQIAKIGGLLLSVSISMILMIGVCKLAARLSVEEMLKGAAFVAAFVLFVKGLVEILKIGNEEQMARVAGTILAMAVAIGVMAGVTILLGLINLADLAKGVAAVSILGLVMTQMIKAAKNAQNCKGNLIVMTVAIAVMAGAVALLSLIDVKDLAGPVAAMTLLMGMFSLMIRSAKDVKGSLPTIIVMTVVVAALAGVVWFLSTLDSQNAIKNAAALSLLMLSMAGTLLVINSFKKSLIEAMSGIVALTALAVAMNFFVDVLQRMEGVKNAITNTLILGGLMLAMTAVLVVLSQIGKIAIKALIGVIGLTALAIPMLAFIGVLQLMSGIQNAVSNAKTLIVLMTTMTLLLIPLTIIGYLWMGAAAGLLALTAMAVPMLAFIGVLAVMNAVQNASTNADLLITLMTTMVDLLTQLALIGPLAFIGVGALAGLEVLMVSLGGIVIAMGALADKIGPLIDKGLPLMIQLASGIGMMIGAFVDGVLLSATLNLPQVGKNLSDFMNNASDFISGAKLIDQKVVDGVKCLSGALVLLTAAELLNGIAQFVSQGNTSFKQLGTGLSDFMSEASGFIEGAKNIDKKVTDGATSLSNLVITLTKAELLSGISSFVSALTGNSSMSAFGAQLTAFGEAMKAFSDSITGENAIDAGAVEAAANAGKLLVEMSNSLPKTGGIWQNVAGEQDIADFGRKCAAFGVAMRMFSDSISGENAIDTKAVEAAAKAGTLMSELQNSLPKTGGIWQAVAGEQDIATFGAKCVAFGVAMKMFSDSISGENTIDAGAIEAAAKAGKLMAELTNSLPKNDGILQSIVGEQDIANFGAKCAAFGKTMSEFPTISITDESIASVKKAGTAIIELQKALPKEDGWIQKIAGQQDIEGFAAACKTFSQALVNLEGIKITDETIQSINKTGGAMTALQQILPKEGGWTSIFRGGDKDLEGFASGCKTFSEAMKNFSGLVITEDTITSIDDAGTMLIKLQEAIPESKWLDGKVNLEEFGSQVSSFKNSLNNVSAFSITDETIESINRTGRMLIRLQKAIPESAWLDGKVELDEFGNNIKKFGDGILKVSEFSITDETIESVNKTGRMLISLQKAIPESTWLDGKVELDEFGKKIKSFGGHLVGYSEKVSGIDFSVVSSSITQSRKFISLANALVDLDLSGVESFKIKNIGSELEGYYNKIDEIDFDIVSSSISSVRRLKSLIQGMAGLDNSGIELFNIKSIGDKLKAYADAVSGIDTELVSSSISNANRLRSFVASLAGLDTSGVGSFKTAIEQLGTTQIGNIVSAFNNAATTLYTTGANIINSVANGMQSRQPYMIGISRIIVNSVIINLRKMTVIFRSVGTLLMTQLAAGMNSQRNKITNTVKNMMSSAISFIKDKYTDFYSAGSYLVDGFVAGISENTFRAEAQAAAMAEAAKQAAEKALGINSPSKVFYKIGDYTGQGFVNALVDYGRTAYDSASSMADYARKGMTNAIGRIQDLINSDMDSQPTIRPVLDLSDVRSGVEYMNGLLPSGTSIGVMSNLNSINSMMNRNNQNGDIYDVVSAIDNLRDDLSSTGGNTYIIDGIRYDDGSAVSEAIQTIIREAKIERRA